MAINMRNIFNLSGNRNLEAVQAGTFGAPGNPMDEIRAKADAMYNNGEEYFVDEQGRIRLGGGISDTENLTRVDSKVFSAPGDPLAEIRAKADAMYEDNGEGYFVDEYGQIRLKSDVTDTSNLTRVDGNSFAAPGDPLAEIRAKADAMYEDNGEGYFVDEYGQIRLKSDVTDTSNLTRVDGNSFAAGASAHSDQWYNRNPMLRDAEISLMRRRYPKAAYDFYPGQGNMYWLVTLKVFENPGITKPWQFMLLYDKDHPNNHGYGGSIKVIPVRPSLDELKTIAKQYGRPGVPHVVSDSKHFMQRYLCTRASEDIADGTATVASAVQATAWAADWAAHFEIGIRDKRVWNKWCDDAHFRWMQVK